MNKGTKDRCHSSSSNFEFSSIKHQVNIVSFQKGPKILKADEHLWEFFLLFNICKLQSYLAENGWEKYSSLLFKSLLMFFIILPPFTHYNNFAIFCLVFIKLLVIVLVFTLKRKI